MGVSRLEVPEGGGGQPGARAEELDEASARVEPEGLHAWVGESGGDSGRWVSGGDSGRWVSGGDSGRWVSGGDSGR